MPEELKEAPKSGAPENNEQTNAEEKETEQNEDLKGGNPTDKKPGDGEPGNGKEEGPEPEQGTEQNEDKTEEVDDYGDFEMPDGVKVAEAELATFKQIAKKHGLSKEAAHEIVAIQAGMVKKQIEEFARFQQELKDQCVEKFGDKLESARVDAARALDKFGGEELRKVLDDFGMGNHPVLLEAFAKIGREVAEDTTVVANSKKTGDVTLEEALYGKK